LETKHPTSIDVHVGARVKQRREQLDISQEALAANLGVTFQQIQKYERGANRISAGRLFELAKALDTTIPYFFEGTRETARMAGLAEEGAAFAGQEDAEIEELVASFRAIKDPARRKSILALARKSAAASSRSRPKTARSKGG